MSSQFLNIWNELGLQEHKSAKIHFCNVSRTASVIPGAKQYPSLISILGADERSWSVSANSALENNFPSFCK